jgi:hypothetical protein
MRRSVIGELHMAVSILFKGITAAEASEQTALPALVAFHEMETPMCPQEDRLWSSLRLE